MQSYKKNNILRNMMPKQLRIIALKTDRPQTGINLNPAEKTSMRRDTETARAPEMSSTMSFTDIT